MVKLVRLLNALHVLVLCGVMLAAFSVEFFLKEEPCPLCFLQRIGLIGIAIALLCNLKFGVKPLHYGLGILSGLFGAGVSLRQTELHVCPGFPPYLNPILGFDLYFWAFIVVVCSFLAIVLDLFLYRPEQGKKIEMNWFEKGVFWLTVLVTFANVVAAFKICGLGPCQG